MVSSIITNAHLFLPWWIWWLVQVYISTLASGMLTRELQVFRGEAVVIRRYMTCRSASRVYSLVWLNHFSFFLCGGYHKEKAFWSRETILSALLLRPDLACLSPYTCKRCIVKPGTRLVSWNCSCTDVSVCVCARACVRVCVVCVTAPEAINN